MPIKDDISQEMKSFLGDDCFKTVYSLKGEEFRNVKNRRTLRFIHRNKAYFIKIHKGIGWKEIFKNWIQGKRPVIGAENEYLAIRKLEELGIDTMRVYAYAGRGSNPATHESFLITGELAGKISLEDFCRDWKTDPPDLHLKHAIIRELARVCSKMHFAGVNHRDCYLCHFLLDKPSLEKGIIRLFVLDLHRAEIRKKIPRRMRVKDLAGIFFSSMDLGLSKRDALRFIAEYRTGGKLDKNLWRDVLRTAVKLYRKEWSREPDLND